MTADETRQVLILAGAQGVRETPQCYADVAAALCAPGDLWLDVSGVTHADLSFIQIIMAARRSAGQRGKGLALCAPAAGALRDALERGGFAAPDAVDPACWAAP
jgi:anti-anti-sigma regulatory factor